MPEPNPVWGIHVVQGAVTGALVRRDDAGGFEILEAIAERAPPDAALAVQHARTILTRRGVAARGAFVALPDASGCLVTATIPPDSLDLSDLEISNEMYDWTPFEPDQAELRHQCVFREGRRQERLVAALPRADYRRAMEILETGDVSRLGVGLAGACTWRGAKAMGLVPPGGFLVSTLPHLTEVFAAPADRARRHLLPIGESDLARDPTAVDLLARDIAQLSDYYRALRRGEPSLPSAPSLALAGLCTVSPAVRHRLAAVLGPRLVEGPLAPSIVRMAPRAKPPSVHLTALAGAVGAALEALRAPQDRLVLRHIPADLPPYRERSPLMYVAAAAVVLVAAAAAYEAWRPGATDSSAPSDTARRPSQEPASRRAAPGVSQPGAAPQEPHAAQPPAPPQDALVQIVLDVQTAGPGRVRVKWPSGAPRRTLRRRFLGRDGSGPDGEAVDVAPVNGANGERTDDVPGATGFYAWSLDGAAEARAFIEVRVDVEILGPGAAGGARFALRRTYGDSTATLAVDVAPGSSVAGSDGVLTFESGWHLEAVRTRVDTKPASARVPRFQPDGRTERDAAGGLSTIERVIERERRIFEADAVGPDGARRTWSRKMTDG